MDLFLVALLLPEPANQQIWALKQEVHQVTGSRNAIRLPPHITLVPPTRQVASFAQAATQLLRGFVSQQPACQVVLKNFAWFQNRTLYLPVTQADELFALYARLYQQCQQHLPEVPVSSRPFVPHVTLATRDLPPDQVPALRALFAHRSYVASIMLGELVLFRHDGRSWQVESRFELAGS